MSNYHYVIEISDELSQDLQAMGDESHKLYAASHGVICNYKSFSMVVRSTTGKVLGALSGYTAYAEIYVEDIWVDAEWRKRGVGARLLNELENRYKGQGYNNINLVTNEFQATGFYEKCGFEIEFVRVNKHNPQLAKTFYHCCPVN